MRNSGEGGGSRTLMGRLSPADFHTVYGFRWPELLLLEILFGLRSGLSLHPLPDRGLGPAGLVSLHLPA